jgi:hypothetical protein
MAPEMHFEGLGLGSYFNWEVRRMNRKGLFCFVLVALLAMSAPVFAQKITGDITGTVSDASGAVIAGATVTVVNKSTNLTRTTTTGENGFYRIPELPVGLYKVTITHQGFKTAEREAQVTTGQITTADFSMQVGDRAEVVVVEAATPVIEFTGQVNNYVDEERINNIPLNGRDFNSLLGITPGVQRAPGGGFLAVNISGARRTANNYLLDGMYNNDRYYGDSSLNQTGVVGRPATLVPMDAIQEFTVQQTPSAEFGVKGGAAINVQIKSGTNTLHGSAHYYRHDDWTDARNYFDTGLGKTPIRSQQYGGTVGGPIIKDRTFFFAYWEAERFYSLAPYTEDTITTAMVTEARARIACNAAVATILMLGCVPQATSTAGERLFSFYPVITSTSLTPIRTTVSIPFTSNGDSFAFKLDHKFNDQHALVGRYIIGDNRQSAPAFVGTWAPPAGNFSGLGPDGFNSAAPSRAQQLGVNWTWNPSPTKVLEARFGYQRFSQILGPNNNVDPRALGIDTGPLDPLDFGVPAVYYMGPSYMGYIGGVGGYPIVTQPNDSMDVALHYTQTKGSHTLKIGGNWQRAKTFSIRNRARTVLGFYGYYGYYYSGNGDVDAIIQMLLGRADLAARAFGETTRHLKQDSVGLYVNDDWKIHPRVTVSLGLRFDVSGALGERNNRGSNFFPSAGLLDLGAGIDALYDTDWNNFGPRVGFAWDVFGNGKTALRAGYSLTYDVPNFGSIHAPRTGFSPLGARNGAFTQINQGIFSVRRTGSFLTPSGFPEDPTATCLNATGVGDFICLDQPLYGPAPTATPPFDVFSVVEDFRTPSYHYWNATLQHELFRDNVLTVTYLGSRGRDMLMYRDLNARPIGCFTTVQLFTGTCARPFEAQFPNFENIIQLTNLGKSWYDSLQVSYRQNNWKGINSQYNLTWGHCLDLNSINRGSRLNLPQMMNPLDVYNNKGSCDHDVTLNFNVGGTYDIPKVDSWGRFGSGWQIGTVFHAIDGRPFTPNIGSRDRSGQQVGTIRANCSGPVSYNTRDPNNYIANPGVFSPPANGTVGNCGRNILRGPGLQQWDFSVLKETKITERWSIQFRWEVFNLLNRANFGSAGSNIRASSFGTISATPDTEVFNPVIAQGGPRNMQFVLKLKF